MQEATVNIFEKSEAFLLEQEKGPGSPYLILHCRGPKNKKGPSLEFITRP